MRCDFMIITSLPANYPLSFNTCNSPSFIHIYKIQVCFLCSRLLQSEKQVIAIGLLHNTWLQTEERQAMTDKNRGRYVWEGKKWRERSVGEKVREQKNVFLCAVYSPPWRIPVLKWRLPELENRQVISRPGEHGLTGTQPDYAEERKKEIIM